MGVCYNSEVFYGYEVAVESVDLIEKGLIPEYWEEEVEDIIDRVYDGYSGCFLYIGKSLSSADMYEELGEYEISLTPEIISALKEKIEGNEILKLLTQGKEPKLYHIVYAS